MKLQTKISWLLFMARGVHLYTFGKYQPINGPIVLKTVTVWKN